jgi:hypothetical protein
MQPKNLLSERFDDDDDDAFACGISFSIELFILSTASTSSTRCLTPISFDWLSVVVVVSVVVIAAGVVIDNNNDDDDDVTGDVIVDGEFMKSKNKSSKKFICVCV